MQTRKKLFIIILLLVVTVVAIGGGTLAYWSWQTSSEQNTRFEFTVTRNFECSADGGGDITEEDTMLAPAFCTDNKHAIMREVNVSSIIYDNMSVYMNLWLNVNNLGVGLKNSENFKYALTTSNTSCTDGVISSGNFHNKGSGDMIELLNQKEFVQTSDYTYYLYIWLDVAESSPDTMNQAFDFSLGGECSNIDKKSYAVYSETDNSLRFYKTVNIDGVLNNDGLTPMSYRSISETENTDNLTIYSDIENAVYKSASELPWYEYADSITKVVVEDEMFPISTAYWFSELKNVTYIDLSKLDTSRVTNMSGMFYDTGYNSSSLRIVGLNDWNTSKVTNMSYMFYRAGYKTKTFDIGDLSMWNTSNVTNMAGMFMQTALGAGALVIGDIGKWTVSNVVNMESMFEFAGYCSGVFYVGDLSGWDVSKVTKMLSMFRGAGQSAKIFDIGDLSNWNVSRVTRMEKMFNYAGENSTIFDIGDLGKWDVSRVTNMSEMFFNAGYNATMFNIGDISKWNTSNVTNMNSMFINTGYTASNWGLDLSGWNVSKVTTHTGFNSNVEAKIVTPLWSS